MQICVTLPNRCSNHLFIPALADAEARQACVAGGCHTMHIIEPIEVGLVQFTVFEVMLQYREMRRNGSNSCCSSIVVCLIFKVTSRYQLNANRSQTRKRKKKSDKVWKLMLYSKKKKKTCLAEMELPHRKAPANQGFIIGYHGCSIQGIFQRRLCSN